MHHDIILIELVHFKNRMREKFPFVHFKLKNNPMKIILQNIAIQLLFSLKSKGQLVLKTLMFC